MVRQTVEHRLKLEHARHSGDPVGAGLCIKTLDVQRKHDVLAHGQRRIERIELEHHRDVALVGPQIIHPLSSDDDVAGACALKPRDDAQGCRLAASGRTQEANDFPRRDRKAHILDGGEFRRNAL